LNDHWVFIQSQVGFGSIDHAEDFVVRFGEQPSCGDINMDLTASDAFRIIMTKVAKEKVRPLELKIPNSLSAQTIEKAEPGYDQG
jgi:hypothetical protein